MDKNPLAIAGVKVKVAQSCLTLCHPVDFTVHWILQARILTWVAFPFSRGSSEPRSPLLQVDSWPTEPPGKPVGSLSLLQGIFLTQESNLGLLHCRWILYQLSCQGSPPKSGCWGCMGQKCRGHRFHSYSPQIPHALEQLKMHVTQLPSPHFRAREPQLLSLRPAATEASEPRACAPQLGKPLWGEARAPRWSSPCSGQLEKTCAQQRDPVQQKTNDKWINKLLENKNKKNLKWLEICTRNFSTGKAVRSLQLPEPLPPSLPTSFLLHEGPLGACLSQYNCTSGLHPQPLRIPVLWPLLSLGLHHQPLGTWIWERGP